MQSTKAFLALERTEAGWRFWLLWVLATNLGFFPGIALNTTLTALVPQGANAVLTDVLRGTVGSIAVALLIGVFQSLVLRRHLAEKGGWALASIVGWPLGIFLAGLLIRYLLFPNMDPASFIYLILLGAFAGLVLGFAQWLVLRPILPNIGLWWPLVSFLGYLVFFPGMVTGAVLARLIAARTSS